MTRARPLVLGLEQNGICMSAGEFDAVSEFNELDSSVIEREIHQCRLLPGLELRLSQLSAAADRWDSQS